MVIPIFVFKPSRWREFVIRAYFEIIRLLSKLAGEPEPKTGAEKTGESIGKLFRKSKK